VFIFSQWEFITEHVQNTSGSGVSGGKRVAAR